MSKIVIIAMCFVCSNIFAQQPVKGIIKDKTTGSPLMFVSVYAPELEAGTTSNNNGEFTLDLAKGTFKLIVSMVGYETKSIIIDVPIENTLEIFLTESAIEMEEVIVSTPFHKIQSENVMKVEQKNIKELKASGAINLADGITNITGVESVSTGTSIGKPVIRGLSSNRVLVYSQSVRLENQQYGDEHGLGLNDAGIESIEIIKGPASLLYGSDALGGVLYLNPERFARTNTYSADANFNYYSNTKGYSTNAGYKSSSDGFKYIFRGSITEHSDYKTTQYRVTNTRYREQDFKAAFGYQSNLFKTELRYNLNNSKLGLPEEIAQQSLNRTPLLPYQHIDNHILSLKSTVFFVDSSLDVVMGILYNNRKEIEDHHHEDDEDSGHDGEVLEPALHMKLKTFNYNIKYNLPKQGRFETIIGVQGMLQSNSNYGEEQLIPDAITKDFGVLATSHIHFEKIDIQIGARYDFRKLIINDLQSKSFNSYNGALGFKTNLLEKLTARLNVASGFRAPNLAELGSNGTHEGTNRFEVGNINLNNEQNYQIDFALEFKNEHLEIFSNIYYNRINNYIFLKPNGEYVNNDPVYLYTQKSAYLYGGEFGVHIHPHPLDWLHIESGFESVTGRLNNGEDLPLIPANSITNTLRIEFNSKTIFNNYVFVKLRSTFAKNDVNTFETPSSAYNLLSAGLGGTINFLNNELNVNISSTNILNTNYIHHLSRLKSDGILNMGRNINIGLTYTL